jgi:hypothetical protein
VVRVDPDIVEPKLARENFIVLSAIQALHGSLSTNVTAARLEFVRDDLRAHFLFRAEDRADRQEIEENFPTEVEVLLLGVIDPVPGIETVIHVAAEWESSPLSGRSLWCFRD